MSIEELRIEIDSNGVKEEVEKMFKHSIIRKNFHNIVSERMDDNKCLVHGEQVKFEKFKNEDGEGYKLQCCCQEYGELAEIYLKELRQDLWKLCLVLAVTHKKIGCDEFTVLLNKLEKYEFKGVEDFFNTFYRACIELTIFDQGSEGLKEKFETLFEATQSNIH